MGSTFCLPEEDKGVHQKGQMAVGADSNQINDEALDIALG